MGKGEREGRVTTENGAKKEYLNEGHVLTFHSKGAESGVAKDSG